MNCNARQMTWHNFDFGKLQTHAARKASHRATDFMSLLQMAAQGWRLGESWGFSATNISPKACCSSTLLSLAAHEMLHLLSTLPKLIIDIGTVCALGDPACCTSGGAWLQMLPVFHNTVHQQQMEYCFSVVPSWLATTSPPCRLLVVRCTPAPHAC